MNIICLIRVSSHRPSWNLAAGHLRRLALFGTEKQQSVSVPTPVPVQEAQKRWLGILSRFWMLLAYQNHKQIHQFSYWVTVSISYDLNMSTSWISFNKNADVKPRGLRNVPAAGRCDRDRWWVGRNERQHGVAGPRWQRGDGWEAPQWHSWESWWRVSGRWWFMVCVRIWYCTVAL